MDFPEDVRYSEEHEWARVDGEEATVGITEFAQDELGDVVYVELPAVGAEIEANSTFGVIESVKAVSDLFAPVSGKVIEVNEALKDQPELVNSDPYDDGWMLVIKMSNPKDYDNLLTAEAYRKHVEKE